MKKIPRTQYQGGKIGWVTRMIDPRKEYDLYLQTEDWQQKRQDAIERAEYYCERCGSEKRLQVHHKTYKNVGDEKPEDLEVLCADCHFEEHHAT